MCHYWVSCRFYMYVFPAYLSNLLFFTFSQPDAVFFKVNQPFFVQAADGLLECFFADAEKVGDYFRATFIGDRDKPTLLLQVVHYFSGQGIDGFVAGLLQAKVYFFIVTHFFDKPVNFLADFQRLKHFVFIQDALVGAVDDGDKSHLGLIGDEQCYFLAVMKTGLFFFGPAFFMFSYYHCIALAIGADRSLCLLVLC